MTKSSLKIVAWALPAPLVAAEMRASGRMKISLSDTSRDTNQLVGVHSWKACGDNVGMSIWRCCNMYVSSNVWFCLNLLPRLHNFTTVGYLDGSIADLTNASHLADHRLQHAARVPTNPNSEHCFNLYTTGNHETTFHRSPRLPSSLFGNRHHCHQASCSFRSAAQPRLKLCAIPAENLSGEETLK